MPRKTKESENENEKISTKSSKVAKKTPTKTKATKTTAKKGSKSVAKSEEKSTTSKKTTKATTTKKSPTTKSLKKSDDKTPVAKKTKTASTKKTSDKSATEKKVKSTATRKTTATKKSTTVKETKDSTTKKAKNSTKTKKVSNKSSKSTSTRKSTKNTDTKKVEIVEYYDLPYRYNQTVVKILAQTPTNLFIYWDISDKDRQNLEKQYGVDFFYKTKPVLIVHNTTIGYSFEVEINDFANSWYLHVADAKCDYTIELGRRPIEKNEKITENYIYISTSNKIESPNNRILFDKNQKIVYFRNVKTGEQTSKNIASINFLQTLSKLYNIDEINGLYELYKELYQEDINKLYDLSNPSSGNPSSSSLSSRFM